MKFVKIINIILQKFMNIVGFQIIILNVMKLKLDSLALSLLLVIQVEHYYLLLLPNYLLIKLILFSLVLVLSFLSVLQSLFEIQLKDIVASLFELWNLMDSSIEEKINFSRYTSILRTSESEITEPGFLATEIIEQVWDQFTDIFLC